MNKSRLITKFSYRWNPGFGAGFSAGYFRSNANCSTQCRLEYTDEYREVKFTPEDKYLLYSLQYFFGWTDSRILGDFLEGLRKVHDGDLESFGADDAEDYAQVGIYIKRDNKDFVEVIGSYENAKELGISNHRFVPYDEFIEFLEYWKLFLEQVEKLRLVPVDYIKEDRLEEVEKGEQFKEIENKLKQNEKPDQTSSE